MLKGIAKKSRTNSLKRRIKRWVKGKEKDGEGHSTKNPPYRLRGERRGEERFLDPRESGKMMT